MNKLNINLSETHLNDLIKFVSSACLYAEEGRKIKSSIIIGKNITDANFLKITQATANVLIRDKCNEASLGKRLKSLVPFCNSGWRVFIDFVKDEVYYGVIRNFTGPKGLDFESLLNSMSDDEYKEFSVDYILIDVISNYEIFLCGNKGSIKIDFRLHDQIEQDSNSTYDLLQDLLGKISHEKDQIEIAFKKVVDLFPEKLHGCILLVIDKDYSLPDNIIKDGIFLDPPIDIVNILISELNEANNEPSGIISSFEKYNALISLMIDMLNFDGITIMDNCGRLRAYNVFVKSDISSDNSLLGGARKRAAEFLAQQHNYIGVYFQSQDGVNFYKRIEHE